MTDFETITKRFHVLMRDMPIATTQPDSYQGPITPMNHKDMVQDLNALSKHCHTASKLNKDSHQRQFLQYYIYLCKLSKAILALSHKGVQFQERGKNYHSAAGQIQETCDDLWACVSALDHNVRVKNTQKQPEAFLAVARTFEKNMQDILGVAKSSTLKFHRRTLDHALLNIAVYATAVLSLFGIAGLIIHRCRTGSWEFFKATRSIKFVCHIQQQLPTIKSIDLFANKGVQNEIQFESTTVGSNHASGSRI